MKQILLSALFIGLMSTFSYGLAQDTNQESVITPQENTELIVSEQANETDEDLDHVANKIRKFFGEELGDALAEQVRTITPEDKSKLIDAISKHDHHDDRGPTLAEAVIAVTAIVFSVGLPVLLIIVISIFGIRKRRQQMNLIQTFLESGKDVPESVLNNFGSSTGVGDSLRSGLTLVGVGLAIGIIGVVLGTFELSALGLIPAFIGIARLLYWKYTQDNDQQS